MRFSFRHDPIRVDPVVVAEVRHSFARLRRGEIEVSLPPEYTDPRFARSLARAIEEYYRQRVGVDGSLIRVGAKGVAPLILGERMLAPARAEFEAHTEEASQREGSSPV